MTDTGGEGREPPATRPSSGRSTAPPEIVRPTAVPAVTAVSYRSLTGARRDALIYFPASAIPALVSALQTAIFTQIYTPVAWGRYALALSIVQLVVTTMSSWHERATVRFVSAEEGRLEASGSEREVSPGGGPAGPRPARDLASRLTWWNVGLFAVLGLPALVMVAAIWPESLYLTAAGVVFGVGSLLNIGLSAIHRALLHSWFVVRSRLVASIAGLVFSLLAVYALGPLPSLLMLGPGLGMLLAGGMLWRDLLRKKPALAVSGTMATIAKGLPSPTPRTFLRFGVPLAGFYIAGWVLNLSDRFLLYSLAGAQAVGVYAPNYAIGALVISLATIPLSTAMTSRLLRLSDASEADEIGDSVGRASRDFLLVTVPVLIWILLAKDQISSVLLGAEFRGGAAVIPLVAAGSLTWALGQYVHKPLEMRNKTVTLLLLAIICSALNVGLNLVLIPWLGYMGAAWSTFLAYSLYPFLAYILTLSSVRWEVPWRTFGSLVLVALVSLILGVVLSNTLAFLHPVFMGAALAFLVAAVSLLVLLLTGEINLSSLRRAVREVLHS